MSNNDRWYQKTPGFRAVVYMGTIIILRVRISSRISESLTLFLTLSLKGGEVFRKCYIYVLKGSLM
jgi:hypothetical protein